MPETHRSSVRYDLGLPLEAEELEALRQAGIRDSLRVETIKQQSGRSVYRFDESGGALGDLGHYAGFVPLAGHRLLLNLRITVFGGNKEHRRLIGAAGVRFEVFRYRSHYVHAYVTLHAGGTDHLLFRARYGEIDKDDHVLFPPETGIEKRTIPSFLIPGFESALAGSRCPNCKCAGHFATPKDVEIPEAVLSALHVELADAPNSNRGGSQVAALKEGN